ncbi:MAG: septal ring lytic transglycosylase RlpA family protein [Candidatus Puniceispirillaceae bacterium]
MSRNCQFRHLKPTILLLFLAGCSTAELTVDLIKKSKKRVQQVEIEKAIEDGTITANPIYKIGNPYQVGGVWYYPERDLAYDETGIGSWYGDEFAGRLTANGEIFDPDMVTAAHKTLPMPSVVRVTNLDNGKSLVVRINDRGPFVAGRVIDLSREAARLIGYRDQGIARVRVQVLAEQTLRLEKLAKSGNFAEITGDVVAMPTVAVVEQPEVSMTATSSTGKTVNSDAEDDNVSALELLTRSRVGEVITVAPIRTQLWVQVGAFYAQANASNVLAKIEAVGTGQVSPVDVSGQTLHRVRIGPLSSVEAADRALDGVIGLGFSGARIIVD